MKKSVGRCLSNNINLLNEILENYWLLNGNRTLHAFSHTHEIELDWLWGREKPVINMLGGKSFWIHWLWLIRLNICEIFFLFDSFFRISSFFGFLALLPFKYTYSTYVIRKWRDFWSKDFCNHIHCNSLIICLRIKQSMTSMNPLRLFPQHFPTSRSVGSIRDRIHSKNRLLSSCCSFCHWLL